jgi:voltage-gated potassium channel
VGLTIIGTLGLVYFEGWSFFNALWVTVVSLTTTGFGDIVPVTIYGRVFLLFILVAGVGIVGYGVGVIVSVFIESQISRVLERNKMLREIEQLRNHIIVCGAGRVGSNVAFILKNERAPYVLIDSDEELVVHMREAGHLAIQGDATQDEVLLAAGIEKASGIVCALSEDAYNVFITLTARAIKPGLKIVARAERLESVEKLRRAGANKVIAPAQIGGHQLAMAILKPAMIEMVDTLFSSRQMELQLEEVLINSEYPLGS